MSHRPSSPRSRRAAAVLGLAAGLLAAAATAPAQMPNSISYQAYLTDNIGNPITSASVLVTFRFYDSETGLTPFASHTTPAPLNLAVTGGFVNTTVPITFSPNRLNNPFWVEVAVDDGSVVETLAPRQLVVPAATALNANRLDGLDSTDFVLARRAATLEERATFKGGLVVAPDVIDGPQEPNVNFATINGETRQTGLRSVAGMQAQVRAAGAGAKLPAEPSAVRAILSEGASDGLYVTGLAATGFYFGANESMDPSELPSVLGVNALARFDQQNTPPDNVKMNAIGVSARAAEAQAGPNTGILGAARNSTLQNIGVSGVVGATEADALEFQSRLPEGFSAALFGYARGGEANDYGLYSAGRARVAAPGSEIGDGANALQLRVTGTPSGAAAAWPVDYEVDISGDTNIAGDLRLASGAMNIGSGPDGAYLRSAKDQALTITPGNGEIVVAGRIRQTAAPEADEDLATLAWVRDEIARARPAAPAPAAAAPVSAAPVREANAGGDFTYAAPRRRVLSFPAAAFKPARPSYDYISDGSLLRDLSPEADDGGQRYTTPVFLPDGAVIRRVTLEATDAEPAAAVAFSLVSVAAGSALPVGGQGVTDDSGIQTAGVTVSDDDPFRVVDNGAFAYVATVTFSENAKEALEVYTFRVEYDVTRAD